MMNPNNPLESSLVKQLANPLSQQAGKWLVIPRSVCCRGFSPLQPRRTPCGCRRESSKTNTPRSGQNLEVELLRRDILIDWIPAFAGMTGRQRGFSLVSAIFLLVVIATLGAFAVTVSNSQHQSDAMDVMGKRTYQAARAGIEWGAFQITQSAVAGTTFALNCQSAGGTSQSLTLPSPLSSFSVNVACSTGGASYVDATSVWVYTLTSTANTTATPGNADYFNRSLTVTISQ